MESNVSIFIGMVGLIINDVLEIECKQEYEALLKLGMAWEFYPWITGSWSIDKDRFITEVYNKNANTKN